jgi:hypothetical protein
MVDWRTTCGVALLASLALIVITGFVAVSSRDLYLTVLGFAVGLFSAYWADHLKISRARRG